MKKLIILLLVLLATEGAAAELIEKDLASNYVMAEKIAQKISSDLVKKYNLNYTTAAALYACGREKYSDTMRPDGKVVAPAIFEKLHSNKELAEAHDFFTLVAFSQVESYINGFVLGSAHAFNCVPDKEILCEKALDWAKELESQK